MKSARARLLLVSSLLAAQPQALSAQADTIGVGAAISRAREALGGLGALWGADSVAIDWLFVSRSNALRTRGAKPLETIVLPAGAPRANTSYTLGDERLAMIVLPLGGDVDANARLLVHEAMHTLQPSHLPHPGNTEPMDGADLLDRADGRIWLFLELRALAQALASDGAQRIRAAHDALAFRAHRDRFASATERARLDALDLAEGIPEYTGWRLMNAPAALLVPQLERARDRSVSWVRSVSYYTGPAYGYLLDALGGSRWHGRWRAGERLPELLRNAIGADPSTATVEDRARRYDGGPVIAAEIGRDAQRARTLDSLRTRYLRQPVLRIVPATMQVTFDPNGQVPLDDQGTVMKNFRWASTDGAELTAPDGALVSPSWSHMQVPLGDASLAEGVVSNPLEISGRGWRLRLPAGWVVRRVGLAIEVRPPSGGASPASAAATNGHMHAQVQAVGAHASVLAPRHDVFGATMTGGGVSLRLGRSESRVGLRFAAAHLRSSNYRIGIACAGAAMPGTCVAESLSDDTRATIGTGGMTYRLFGSELVTSGLTADATLAKVRADTGGLVSGRELTASKGLWGGLVGLEASWTHIAPLKGPCGEP